MWIHLLVDLRKRVEQAPGRPFFKVRVSWLSPFLQYAGNLGWGDRFAVYGSNNEIVGCPIGQSPGERTFTSLRKKGFNWSFQGIAHKDRITCPGDGRHRWWCSGKSVAGEGSLPQGRNRKTSLRSWEDR
jgi:hypothetical protein